jgi:single-stranded-DNA-specific exonuclease
MRVWIVFFLARFRFCFCLNPAKRFCIIKRLRGERMLKSKTRWVVQQANEEKVRFLQEELGISPLVAALLVNRGIETPNDARNFLFMNEQSFHDPFLLKDMDKAVARIKTAIEKNEHIFIFGDYDADGVTSTALMVKTLRDLGAHVEYYIPNRFTEGYGPNEGAFRFIAECGARLIITVDTGIAALHEAEIAKELGIDLIITDHHEPGPSLPDVYAIIHPKLADGTYPFRDLAGVGVAFKLAHALYGFLPKHLLDIVVIGTIADLVPLRDENRLIAKCGLAEIKRTKSAGLQALFRQAGVNPASINEETIGFILGPRMNAAGRLDSADLAVELLLTDFDDEAEAIAAEIEELNKQRQSIVNEITEDAIKEVEENFPIGENRVLVIGKEGWNPGVIGIVASKLVERFYRPTIVLSYDAEKGLAKGSARSIAGFDLFQNLSACRDLLPHFGGHPMAAGMTLKIADVKELRKRLNALAEQQLTEEDFIPAVKIDCVASLDHIDLKAVEEMDLLAPYGVDNPKPKVLIDGAAISSIRKIGSEQNHLKVSLDASSGMLDGIGFGLGHLYDHISPHAKLSVIGELAINEWNNVRKPQIFLHDLAVNSWQMFDYRGHKNYDKIVGSIPEEGQKWVIFHPESQSLVPEQSPGSMVLIESIEEAKSAEIDGDHVVLVDLPPSKEHIEHLLRGKKPSRIYVHFYKRESDFFSTIPTREHFKWFYAFLAQKGPFNIKQHGHALAQYRGWTKETIVFMAKVFFELDFVTINNGIISLKQNTKKRDLAESTTYQLKMAQISLENDLLYSSFQQLKNWFDQLMQGSANHEEEEKAWI